MGLALILQWLGQNGCESLEYELQLISGIQLVTEISTCNNQFDCSSLALGALNKLASLIVLLIVN